MVGLGPAGAAPLLPAGAMAGWLLGLFVIAWFMPNSQQLLREDEPVLETGNVLDPVTGPLRRLVWRPSPVLAVAVAALCMASLVFLQRVREFIYFQG